MLYSTSTFDFDLKYFILLFVNRVDKRLRRLVTSIRFSRLPARYADRFIGGLYDGVPVAWLLDLPGLEEVRLLKGMIREQTMQKAMESQFLVNGKKLMIVIEEE